MLFRSGKKVLVIHPFEDSIKKQYEKNRTHIFERIYDADDILPEFELITLKAVQTLAGEHDSRFATWFEALNWMIEQCKKIEFDVAIIGCGAYGFPLAAELKRMGKTAIHLGGATQIVFGIVRDGQRQISTFRFGRPTARCAAGTDNMAVQIIGGGYFLLRRPVRRYLGVRPRFGPNLNPLRWGRVAAH